MTSQIIYLGTYLCIYWFVYGLFNYLVSTSECRLPVCLSTYICMCVSLWCFQISFPYLSILLLDIWQYPL